MLKKCYGLFLGLVVLAGSACVTPTHASSASVMMVHIQAGSSVGALDEGVVLYNNSSFEADISGWCLMNKAQVKFGCLTLSEDEQIILPAFSYTTVVSSSMAGHIPFGGYATTYEPSNQSSGAIVAGSDTLSLLNADGQLIDQYTWTSSISSSQQWSRMILGVFPDIYLDTNSTNDWQKQPQGSFPLSEHEYRLIDNGIGEQPPEPETPEEPNGPIENTTLLPAIITELLPNAAGSDTGNEFIEIYNPNAFDSISLEGYVLSVGPALEKKIILDAVILQPNEYKILTNSEYSFSLLNTSSRVSLTTAQGLVSDETPLYNSPADDEAWANIEGIWQYTNQPTPGQANIPSLDDREVVNEENSETFNLKPCAANQYRSPETNRCRLLSSATSATPAECKAGQERNPETNRCRNIALSTPTACKEGQERNPETNRCRNIKEITKADFAVKGASIQQQGGLGWYMWAAIAGVVLLIIGYAVWEWREELKKLFMRIKAKFAGGAN